MGRDALWLVLVMILGASVLVLVLPDDEAVSGNEDDTNDGTSGILLHSKQVDLSRIVITGHSMGGHGAWIQATHYPDGLVGLAPAAGWLRKESYGYFALLCFLVLAVHEYIDTAFAFDD